MPDLTKHASTQPEAQEIPEAQETPEAREDNRNFIDLNSVEYTTFQPLLKKTFLMTSTSPDVEPLPFLLDRMEHQEKPQPKTPEDALPGRRHTFSLYFHGPDGVYIPQGTYALKHPDSDQHFKLFMVPIGQLGEYTTSPVIKKDKPIIYQAVFS